MESIVFAIIGLTAFLTFIIIIQYLFPLIQKSSLTFQNPHQRSRPLLWDRRYGVGEIIERRDIAVDRFILTLHIGNPMNPKVIKQVYYDNEIIPWCMKQVLADDQPPIFVCLKDTSTQKEVMQNGGIKNDADYWRHKYDMVIGDVEKQIQRRIDSITQVERARRPDNDNRIG